MSFDCLNCGMESAPRIAGHCIHCAESLLSAAKDEGWRVFNGVAMKPCPHTYTCTVCYVIHCHHDPYCTQPGDAIAVRGFVAAGKLKGEKFFCQSELERKSEQPLKCTLKAGHAGAHAEGELNWRSKPKKEKSK